MAPGDILSSVGFAQRVLVSWNPLKLANRYYRLELARAKSAEFHVHLAAYA